MTLRKSGAVFQGVKGFTPARFYTTAHARERLEERDIPVEEVVNSINKTKKYQYENKLDNRIAVWDKTKNLIAVIRVVDNTCTLITAYYKDRQYAPRKKNRIIVH